MNSYRYYDDEVPRTSGTRYIVDESETEIDGVMVKAGDYLEMDTRVHRGRVMYAGSITLDGSCVHVETEDGAQLLALTRRLQVSTSLRLVRKKA